MKNETFANQLIKIRLANGEVYPFSGEFQFTDNQLNKSTNTLAIYVDFANPKKELIPNGYVDVIIAQEMQNSVLIPRSLVVMQTSGNFVYVANNNIINKHPLNILGTKGDNYLVSNNFKPDDLLVLDRISRFSPNEKVQTKLVENK